MPKTPYRKGWAIRRLNRAHKSTVDYALYGVFELVGDEWHCRFKGVHKPKEIARLSEVLRIGIMVD